MLNEAILENLQELLTKQLQIPVIISDVQSLSGGDINDVFKLKSTAGYFVLKQNYADRYPQMFEKEALGLKLLNESSKFRIPKIIGFSEVENQSFLVLEYIQAAYKSADFWEVFAENLAELHKNSSDNGFGLDYDNYIGSLAQGNQWTENWYNFYAEQRLLPLFHKAFDSGCFNKSDSNNLDRVLLKLPEIIPSEKPALIHGDLWSGNYLIDDNGAPCLIDPAVYYGHRETELAFMQLFGGFDASLYENYHSIFPIESGFQERKDLHQLYPLLVHSVLFGGHYVQQVKGVLNKWAN